jgi:predicted dehydrogenase
MTTSVLLVGAGPMARAYVGPLLDLGVTPVVIGRGEQSSGAFEDATGIEVTRGGLGSWLEQGGRIRERVIIAAPVAELALVTSQAVDAGAQHILVEKPAARSVAELAALQRKVSGSGADIRVAYNRRFYASVLAAKQLIEEDRGVTSFTFEFTEDASRIAATSHPPEVKRNWFLANSSHVADLAFYLGGSPVTLETVTAGALEWHPDASRFAGIGRTEDGATFSYHADWESSGRWGVEIMTRRRRIVLRPLEQLQVQMPGSYEIEGVELDDSDDVRFKAGLRKQLAAFLSDGTPRDQLPTLAEHSRRARDVFAPMSNESADPPAT